MGKYVVGIGVLLAVLSAAGCATPQAEVRLTAGDEPQQIEVMPGLRAKVLFGFWGSDGERPGTPADTVVLDPDLGLGITVDFDCDEDFTGTVRYKEVFTSPSGNDWSADPSVPLAPTTRKAVSADGKSATTEAELSFVDGEPQWPTFRAGPENTLYTWVALPPDIWRLTADDKPGIREFKVYLNDRLVRAVTFEVLPPKDDAPAKE